MPQLQNAGIRVHGRYQGYDITNIKTAWLSAALNKPIGTIIAADSNAGSWREASLFADDLESIKLLIDSTAKPQLNPWELPQQRREVIAA